MGASIHWEVVEPDKGHRLSITCPSTFMEKAKELGLWEREIVSGGSAALLIGLGVGMGDEVKKALEPVREALANGQTVRLWAEW
jgi:hypothetical protein